MIEIRPGVMSDVKDIEEWKQRVLERDGGACINCELTKRVAVCFVIPPDAGGKLRVSNGVTICRGCRIAADGARALPQRISNKTPINFLMSTKLHQWVHSYAHNGSQFGSVSALLRAMITSFITQPELYEDLSNWQDAGSDVKVNGWVNGAQYEIFKNMCHERSMSYTDALKGLLLVAVEGYNPSSTTSH